LHIYWLDLGWISTILTQTKGIQQIVPTTKFPYSRSSKHQVVPVIITVEDPHYHYVPVDESEPEDHGRPKRKRVPRQTEQMPSIFAFVGLL